jgi:hypothetical protein
LQAQGKAEGHLILCREARRQLRRLLLLLALL